MVYITKELSLLSSASTSHSHISFLSPSFISFQVKNNCGKVRLAPFCSANEAFLESAATNKAATWKLIKASSPSSPSGTPTPSPTPSPIPSPSPSVSPATNGIYWVDVLKETKIDPCLETCLSLKGPGQNVYPIFSLTGHNETALCRVGDQLGSDSKLLGGCLIGNPCEVRSSEYKCACQGDIGEYKILEGSATTCPTDSVHALFDGKKVCNHLLYAPDSIPSSKYPAYYLCTVSPGSEKCDYTYLNKDGVCSKYSANTFSGTYSTSACVCIGAKRS